MSSRSSTTAASDVESLVDEGDETVADASARVVRESGGATPSTNPGPQSELGRSAPPDTVHGSMEGD
jgi:hypothetical protein